MLIKEYRICMPLTVDEYRIGQLYMIARHSHEQSRGNGDGVEVVVNEPCHDEVHGDGQYTEKRIYLTSRLPSWVQGMIPKVFYVIEKAWNYYPFTITEYTCSFLPRFKILIDTKYENNNGSSENLFNLSEELLAQREVVHLDIAYDVTSSEESDPPLECRTFRSAKTGRGPLERDWRETAQPVMCSYKVVKVFFEVWGFQGRVETGVHRAVRDILIHGHREAFLWLDEWHGMSLEQVREYETALNEETNSKVLTGVHDESASGGAAAN